MRFTVQSLGGKLVISAALTLLLCMLLFSAASWYFLKSFYEHEAKNDARIHLASIKSAYQTKIDFIQAGLITEADKSVIATYLTNSKLRTQASKELASTKQLYHLTSITIISI